MPWRRAWKPTPTLLPRESHGQSSLAGCSPWECKESDTIKWLSQIEQKELKTEIHSYRPLIYLGCYLYWCYFFTWVSVTILGPFISPWMTPFSICCRVGLLATNHLNFFFSGNVLISPSFLRVFFVGYTIFSQHFIYIYIIYNIVYIIYYIYIYIYLALVYVFHFANVFWLPWFLMRC